MRPSSAVKLTEQQVAELLVPYLRAPAEAQLCRHVCRYLDLLEVWNAKISLTSVRDPAQIVQRHFGESLFLAERLPLFQTLLDLGSGAGFPGIPIALRCASGKVTLAESQQKKATFLREAVWSLGLKAEVWGNRVEEMPPAQRFDVVALRAVDNMEGALLAATERVAAGGTLAFFAGEGTPFSSMLESWSIEEHAIPLSSGKLVIAKAK